MARAPVPARSLRGSGPVRGRTAAARTAASPWRRGTPRRPDETPVRWRRSPERDGRAVSPAAEPSPVGARALPSPHRLRPAARCPCRARLSRRRTGRTPRRKPPRARAPLGRAGSTDGPRTPRLLYSPCPRARRAGFPRVRCAGVGGAPPEGRDRTPPCPSYPVTRTDEGPRHPAEVPAGARRDHHERTAISSAPLPRGRSRQPSPRARSSPWTSEDIRTPFEKSVDTTRADLPN